jgi:ATP adenylyltransferase
MDEQRLWAPWRMSYIAGERSAETTSQEPIAWLPGADHACFICKAAAAYADQAAARRQNLVLEVSNHTITMLNLYPYNNGHLLVSPLAHKGTLDELSPEELLDGMEVVRLMVRCLGQLLGPDGCNVGLNLGRAAGAGLPGHLHWHIVPRWVGDTNYMTTCADARVIVQSLEAFFDLLKGHLAGT